MSDSEGSFDNDTSVGSFVEDLTHFCGVLQKLVTGEPKTLEGPWGKCGMTADGIDAMMNRLKDEAAAWEEDDGATGMTKDRTNLIEVSNEVLPAFHIALLNWHCLVFYPFHERFTSEYNEYYKEFLSNISSDFLNTFLLQEEREYFLSPYSFSHRVKSTAQNSGRVSYGVAYEATPALIQKAKTVLKKHSIELPEAFSDMTNEGKFPFYGLGWDFGVAGEAHVKIYLHGEAADLPESHRLKRKQAEEAAITGEFSPHVLMAFTYTATGRMLEEKLYLYPESPKQVKDSSAIPSGTLNVAYVVSAGDLNRGEFWQLDVTHSPAPVCDPVPEWRERFNSLGQDIYDKYYTAGMRLDTLGYGGPDNFTVYFPFEP
eukprot:TRINITY_DN1608_c0_g1_i2.p1 TRINITY_DN1608_c0_g1~~TRINITY_DN1608_c0_g1_i2.p1  ORF type:complete len:391 (+),score=77.98 TRINITY_DN1608_c0_g1_i2:59-1174(+)